MQFETAGLLHLGGLDLVLKHKLVIHSIFKCESNWVHQVKSLASKNIILYELQAQKRK